MDTPLNEDIKSTLDLFSQWKNVRFCHFKPIYTLFKQFPKTINHCRKLELAFSNGYDTIQHLHGALNVLRTLIKIRQTAFNENFNQNGATIYPSNIKFPLNYRNTISGELLSIPFSTTVNIMSNCPPDFESAHPKNQLTFFLKKKTCHLSCKWVLNIMFH